MLVSFCVTHSAGKSLHPKFGLLNIAMTPLLDKKVPDMVVVPISIAYEVRRHDMVLFVCVYQIPHRYAYLHHLRVPYN